MNAITKFLEKLAVLSAASWVMLYQAGRDSVDQVVKNAAVHGFHLRDHRHHLENRRWHCAGEHLAPLSSSAIGLVIMSLIVGFRCSLRCLALAPSSRRSSAHCSAPLSVPAQSSAVRSAALFAINHRWVATSSPLVLPWVKQNGNCGSGRARSTLLALCNRSCSVLLAWAASAGLYTRNSQFKRTSAFRRGLPPPKAEEPPTILNKGGSATMAYKSRESNPAKRAGRPAGDPSNGIPQSHLFRHRRHPPCCSSHPELTVEHHLMDFNQRLVSNKSR